LVFEGIKAAAEVRCAHGHPFFFLGIGRADLLFFRQYATTTSIGGEMAMVILFPRRTRRPDPSSLEEMT
jgi:hypothetical protein